jgi:hypothetical protein
MMTMEGMQDMRTWFIRGIVLLLVVTVLWTFGLLHVGAPVAYSP